MTEKSPSSRKLSTTDAELETGASSWPPIPGEFVLGDIQSPVAVCTLASQSLLTRLAGRPEIAIAGRVYTENVGIEKMVRNLLASPSLRVLLLCGRESRHRVGQAILSLQLNGVDPLTRRIRGAIGPEPVLPNLPIEAVESFRARFEVIDLIGEQDVDRIVGRARAWSGEHLAPETSVVARGRGSSNDIPEVIRAEPDSSGAWIYDPLGFFLIHVDRGRGLLLLEHYGQDRRLLHRMEGKNAAELSETAVRLGLLSELVHAAYLGRELGKAEAALRLGLVYQQDSHLKKRYG